MNPNNPQGTNNGGNGYNYNGAAYGAGPQPQNPQQGPPMGGSNIPPQGYYGAPAPQAPAGAKSSVAAGLLGIFLGWVGVHDFYLGYKTTAIIHLCLGGGGFILTIVSAILPFAFAGAGNYGSAIGAVVIMPVLAGIGYLLIAGSGIWGLISGIMCLSKNGKYARDANGVPLI
jgi:TM2 domain-containing membrane protein YozV